MTFLDTKNIIANTLKYILFGTCVTLLINLCISQKLNFNDTITIAFIVTLLYSLDDNFS